ncbi:MAG TPA: acylphosphatase [Clostridia bacterium]|nr:acylphosphatase [Clostridia bacterium]
MKYIFHGNVQGVGFRYFTKQMARRFNISGSVRNKPDGTVELILNDENNNIKEFMEAIKKGNGFMKIKNIEKYDYESNASDFKVKY